MGKIQLRPATADEVPTLVDVLMAAFGNSSFSQAVFPDAATRQADERTWRLIITQYLFQEPGRTFVVAVDQGDDGSEEVAGWAEWVSPGGADPDTPLEQKKAQMDEVKKGWPKSVDRAALTDRGKRCGAAMGQALRAIGLELGQEEQMWRE